jgi:hypothetical protein
VETVETVEAAGVPHDLADARPPRGHSLHL